MIDKILRTAALHGACEKSSTATDWRSLAWLLFSPQGREFCERENFPDRAMWCEIAKHHPEQYGVHVDRGSLTLHGDRHVALVGATDATLYFDAPTTAHIVILAHGARATVRATNYAVVHIVKIGTDCEVTIENDETAIVLW